MDLHIGAWIESILKENQMTQKQFAKILGFREAAVSEWKKGKTSPSLDQVVRMAEYFSVTCDEIIRGVPAKEMNFYRTTGISAESITRLKSTRKKKPFANRFFNFFIKDQRSQLIWSELEKAVRARIRLQAAIDGITIDEIGSILVVADGNLMPFEICDLLQLKAAQVFPDIIKDFCNQEVEQACQENQHVMPKVPVRSANEKMEHGKHDTL